MVKYEETLALRCACGRSQHLGVSDNYPTMARIEERFREAGWTWRQGQDEAVCPVCNPLHRAGG